MTASAMPTTGYVDPIVEELAARIKAGQFFYVGGPPGCGKTERILQAYILAGYRIYIDGPSTQGMSIVFRASLKDRVDAGGGLMPDMQTGITRELPMELIHALMNATEPTAFFIDDLPMATPEVQGSLMKLFESGVFPDCVHISAAGNRTQDKVGAFPLNEALRSRIPAAFEVATSSADMETTDGVVYLQPWEKEWQGWVKWAQTQGNAPFEVVAFHKFTKGAHLYKWHPSSNPAIRFPDYRSWKAVIHSINSGFRELRDIAALIGKPTAGDLVSFMRIANDLPTMEEILMSPHKAKLPAQPEAQYIVSQQFVKFMNGKNAGKCLTYIDRMDRPFAALTVRDVMDKSAHELSNNAHWCEWFVKNQDLFTDDDHDDLEGDD